MFAFLSKIVEMGAIFSPYAVKPDLDCTGEEGAGNGFRYCATIMQGWRKSQEDAYKCELQDFAEGYKYFAVFDGHGGSEVAKYLQSKLHTIIKSFLNEQKDPELALQLGFLSCDSSLREPAGFQELEDLVDKENQATVASIKKNKKAIFAGLISGAGDGCSKDGECSLGNSSKECADPASDSSEDMSCEETLNKSAGNENNSNHENEDDETMSIDENVAQSSNSEMKPNHENKDNGEGRMDTLKYLLNDDLENSDPEDGDFDVEDEATSSESENDDTFEDIEPGVHSGSTGTVLLVDSKRYYCANVGDSRCVLCRDGAAVDLSTDHKPEDPEEMKRIHAAGSVISDGRIDKSLNLSRAFGDFCYKNMSLAPFEQCVTADPSIKTLEIDDKDEFAIIASDGIWNSMSSQEVVDFIKIRLKQEKDLRVICEELCRLIVAPDTSGDGTGCDNMTCVLIQFQTENKESCSE